MRLSWSCKLLANRLLGVHAVKRVASNTATPSVVAKAFTARGLRTAGLVCGASRTSCSGAGGFDSVSGMGCGFVDSMFYGVILPQKRAVKERLGLKFVRGFAHFAGGGGLSGGVEYPRVGCLSRCRPASKDKQCNGCCHHGEDKVFGFVHVNSLVALQ